MATQEAIGVFVGASLPGTVGMREEELNAELLGDGLMLGELRAVVRGDGVEAILVII